MLGSSEGDLWEEDLKSAYIYEVLLSKDMIQYPKIYGFYVVHYHYLLE